MLAPGSILEFPAAMDAEVAAFFSNWSATRTALADAREEIERLKGDNAVLTARIEETQRANAQLHQSLTESLAREGVAIAHAGRMEGMAESARQSLAKRFVPNERTGWLHDLLNAGDKPLAEGDRTDESPRTSLS